MPEETIVCESCGLELEKGGAHSVSEPDASQRCVQALRKAMLRQRAVAADLGMTMSLQFLRALEELAVDPGVGYRFEAFDPVKGERVELAPVQVSGVFAAILGKYRELGDWKPLQETKEQVAHYAGIAGLATGLLTRIVEKERYDGSTNIDADEIIEIETMVKSLTQLGARPPDPDRS